MIGRNDPCLCGSGKKYKKCCALKDEVSTDQLVEMELERILISYFESTPDNYKDLAELESYERSWMGKLGQSISKEEVFEILIGYYLFVARRDLWNRHLVKTLNGPIRAATRTILEAWSHPIVLFGKITSKRKEFFLVDEVLGHETYTIDLKEGMELDEGMLVIGIVLPDTRKHESGLRLIEGLTFIEDQNGSFAENIASMAEASGETTSFDFFKVHLVDIYKVIVEREMTSTDDLIARELTHQQKKVLTIFADEWGRHGFSSELHELMKMIATAYFMKENPAFRKPKIIAAALFQVAYESGMMNAYFTQDEIAALFDVSAGSVRRHVDKLYDVMRNMQEGFDFEEDSGEPFGVAYSIGTDPRITERVNWELYCKTQTETFDSFEDFNVYMNETMNEPFKPKDKKQQAQSLAYDAYEAENDKVRYRLAKKVIALDSESVDGVLFQAEIAKSERKAEKFYQKAIELGEAQFDPEPEIPWGLVTNRPYMRAIFAYGIWLYEEGRFQDAFVQFEKLLEMNPGDHQGARYLAISSAIKDEDYIEASRILVKIEDFSSKDSAYLYLKWLLEFETEETDSESQFLQDAADANAFVIRHLEEEKPKIEYPKQVSISPGSMDEAMYILYLL